MVDVFLFCYMQMMLLLCLIQKINCKKMINCVYSWCRRWRLCVNLAKTNVVHFRAKRRKFSQYKFIMEQMLLIMYVNINISELFFTNIWISSNVQIISQMLQAEHLELL